MLRRIILLLAVAALMAAMVGANSAPGSAQFCDPAVDDCFEEDPDGHPGEGQGPPIDVPGEGPPTDVSPGPGPPTEVGFNVASKIFDEIGGEVDYATCFWAAWAGTGFDSDWVDTITQECRQLHPN